MLSIITINDMTEINLTFLMCACVSVGVCTRVLCIYVYVFVYDNIPELAGVTHPSVVLEAPSLLTQTFPHTVTTAFWDKPLPVMTIS